MTPQRIMYGLQRPAPHPPSEGALAAIDALVTGSRGGLLLVRGADEELPVLARHIKRKAALMRRDAVVVDGRLLDEPWRELATLLAVEAERADVALARALLRAVGEAVVVVLAETVSAWGASLIDALMEVGAGRGRVVMLTSRPLGHWPHATLDSPAHADDCARFYQTLVDSDRPEGATLGRLQVLEQWWHKRPGSEPSPLSLSPSARALYRRISLLRRSCSLSLLRLLGQPADIEPLVSMGALCWWGRHILPERAELPSEEPAAGEPAGDEELLAVAAALVEHEKDGWAQIRAAELFAQAGAFAQARQAAHEALRGAQDAAIRADLWSRFDACLGHHLSQDELASYGMLALEGGNTEQAQRLAARAKRPHSFAVGMMVGRVLCKSGDTGASFETLSAALELAADDTERAIAKAELAELLMETDRLDESCSCARDAIALTRDPAITLLARNALGKVMLNKGEWQQAIAHFSEDERHAARVGRDVDGLRARVNRAVAEMSRGHVVEARALLESILRDGERLGQPRAMAFALANLSTLATMVHNYAEALDLNEASLEEMRGLGDTLHVARQLLNLADLRLRVGMIEGAEQALAQGRRVCGPSVGDKLITFMSLVSAEVQLERRHTLHAAVAADEAIAAARRCGDPAKGGEACRLAAFIALEDGDVRRARRYVTAARELNHGEAAQVQLAIIEVMVARAAGEPFRTSAQQVLARAEEVDDIELCLQAQLLCLQAARAADDPEAAETHLIAACSLRNRIALSLPETLRPGFLARRDLQPLAEIERSTARVAPTKERRRPARRRGKRVLIGDTPAMHTLRKAVHKVGQSDATVVVFGESGTGKELIAEALHQNSHRADGPLVKVNCAALVETLLLSELFGHEKGAFTGAHSRKRGRFEQAQGGTIFLDEIGDISPKTQLALLRVLQEHTFERVGGSGTINIDVRIICATHRNLLELVEAGQFREDLYYRLSGVVIEVPPLRDRLDDLPRLSESLLERVAHDHGGLIKQLAPDALEALSRHRWPGNVRELENALAAGALFADGPIITLNDLCANVATLSYLSQPAADAQAPPQARSAEAQIYAEVREGMSLPDMKRSLERACIERALVESGGNITQAAKLLGMKRPRLSQLVNRFAKKAQQSAL